MQLFWLQDRKRPYGSLVGATLSLVLTAVMARRFEYCGAGVR